MLKKGALLISLVLILIVSVSFSSGESWKYNYLEQPSGTISINNSYINNTYINQTTNLSTSCPDNTYAIWNITNNVAECVLMPTGGGNSSWNQSFAENIFLKLDQTSPQDIINGKPNFTEGLNSEKTIDELVNKLDIVPFSQNWYDLWGYYMPEVITTQENYNSLGEYFNVFNTQGILLGDPTATYNPIILMMSKLTNVAEIRFLNFDAQEYFTFYSPAVPIKFLSLYADLPITTIEDTGISPNQVTDLLTLEGTSSFLGDGFGIGISIEGGVSGNPIELGQSILKYENYSANDLCWESQINGTPVVHIYKKGNGEKGIENFGNYTQDGTLLNAPNANAYFNSVSGDGSGLTNLPISSFNQTYDDTTNNFNNNMSSFNPFYNQTTPAIDYANNNFLKLDQTSPQTFSNINGVGTPTGLLKVTTGTLGVDTSTYLTEETDPIYTSWYNSGSPTLSGLSLSSFGSGVLKVSSDSVGVITPCSSLADLTSSSTLDDTKNAINNVLACERANGLRAT